MSATIELPGLNCGSCGYRTCDEFAKRLSTEPSLIKRCIALSSATAKGAKPAHKKSVAAKTPDPACSCAGCGGDAATGCKPMNPNNVPEDKKWVDSLGREFDFYLEHFPEDPGPRETMKLHNPLLTREMDITVGDTIIGRPLGMSCGCPITHCGVVVAVDMKTCIITWCVTGPLKPRETGFKDVGYYSAESYEGIIRDTRVELKIGMRHYFQPMMCMLQWRHSGLINYINRTKDNAYQVRIEGLWIG